MTAKAPKCPSCGSLMIDEYGTWICLNDSETIESVQLKSGYLKANMPELIQDAVKLGNKPTAKKWRTTGSVISKYRNDAGFPYQGKTPPIADVARVMDGHRLPPWSDTWGEEVQLRYLDILEKLLCPGVKV